MTTPGLKSFKIEDISTGILDVFPWPVTIVDPRGVILYYNESAARLLDRKPEYLGRDVRSCHQKQESNEKIDRMLEEFAQGRKTESGYRTERDGRKVDVAFFPVKENGELKVCVQVVRIVDEF